MILVAKSYSSKSENYISLFNELAVSAYLYVLLMLTDYLETTDTSTREILSWMLTSILMLAIFVNLVYTLVNMSISVFAYLRRMR